MGGRKKGYTVQGIVFLCTGLLFAVFFFGETDLLKQELWLHQLALNLAVFLALIKLTHFMIRPVTGSRKLRDFLSRGETRNLLILFALAVIPRVIWGLAVPARIDSDYGLYVRMGQYYAEHGKPELDNYMLTVAPNAVSYSVLTGLLMRLFGTSAVTLIAFTEILHVCNILLAYGIGRQIMSGPRAFTAAAVFALLPENIFYSNIPGIEAPAMFTALAGLLLLLCGRRRTHAARMLLCGGGGAILMFSACIRPNAWVIMIAAAAWLLREKEAEQPVKRKALRLAALLTGAALVFCGHAALKNSLFGEQKPVNGLGWSLYEGLDLESGGKWTEEKSKRCIEVINEYDPEEADAIFRKEALERFRSYSFPEKLRMILRKGGSLWYESRYSIFSLEGTEHWNDWRQAADFCWTACLALFIWSLMYRCDKPLIHPARNAAGLLLTVILLTTGWHCIGTSIGRYHYMLIPFVLLLTAMLLPGRAEQPVPERSADE